MNSLSGLPVSLPEICAPREELLELLNHAAECQLVYMQAPGGHGKTVTTLLWLKKTGRNAAWCRFDEYDNTPALFYLVFCRSLLSVVPQEKQIADLVNAPTFREAPVEFTIELLTKADYGAEPFVLVLDDFHAISNKTILKSLPYVLKRLPERVTVFVLSRGELADTFSILQNVNKVSVVEAQRLAFSSDEIMQHLANYGRFVTAREAEALRTYSEGWIILINAMVISGQVQVDARKPKLSYKSFFERNVWNDLGKDERQFLMQSAVVGEFTLELCEILTGQADCKPYIDTLLHGNANISVSHGIYRYHEIFRDFLLDQLDKSSIDKQTLYRKTAQHYLDINDYFTARQYSIKSGDNAIIAESFTRLAGDKSLSLDEYVELSRVFHEDELPDDICEELPFLYASKVMFYYFSGNAVRFEFFMDKLKAAMPLIAAKFPQTMEAAMSCFMMDYRIPFAQIAAITRNTPQLPQSLGTQQIGTASFHLPFLHRSGRDFCQLADPAVYKMVVTDISQKLLKENSEGLSLGIFAGLCLEQNRLDEAAQALARAQSAMTEQVSHEVGYAILLGCAEAALLQGDRNGYEVHLAKAGNYVESNGAHYLKRNLWAYEARLGLLDGDRQTAEKWLSHYFVSGTGFEVLYKIYQSLTTARAHIVLGDYNTALSALQTIKKMSENLRRPIDAAEASVLIAIVQWTLGNTREAADILLTQLAVLRPYGFLRVAANEGRAVLPVLSALIRRLDKTTSKDDALYRFTKEVYITAYKQSKHFKGITSTLHTKAVKLSRQQTLILALLAKGHRNAEIVSLAGISLNTVRYHTKLVYQKLEVTNAMDAIVKARQLGLLR